MHAFTRNLRRARYAAVLAAAALAQVPLPARAGWPPAVRAAMTAGMAPRLEVSLPGPLPLFPPTNWWNTEISAAPVDPGSDAFISLHQRGRRQAPPPRLRRHPGGRSLDLRVSVRGRGRQPGEEDRPVPGAGGERRRGASGRHVLSLLSDPRRGHHAAALDRGRRSGQRRQHRDPGPPPARRGSGQPSPLRALQRLSGTGPGGRDTPARSST